MARWILGAGAAALLGNELYSIATGVLRGPGAGTIAAAFVLAAAAAMQSVRDAEKHLAEISAASE